MSRDCRKGYKCPSGKICNPSSGRCVNINGAVGRNLVHGQAVSQIIQKIGEKQCKTPCLANKICNPKTGRCVARAGPIGKRLILGEDKQSSNVKAGKKEDLCSDQKCPADKVCNPKSGKCVLRTGKIGREITKKLQGTSQSKLLKNPKQKQSAVAKPSNHVDYIIGPVSLEHVYSGKYRKNIYMFGDKHHLSSKCPASATGKNSKHIAEFIADTILLNKDKIIDIYLEHTFISAKYPVRPGVVDSYLTQVNKSLDSCAQIKKVTCKYPNVRVHYINIRKTIPKVRILNDIWHHAVNKLPAPKDADTVFPINGDELLALTKIDKQLNAIRDPYVRSYLLQYIMNEMTKYEPTIVDWENIRNKTKQLKQSADKIIKFISALMDGYLLTRLFRSYSRSREGKSSADSMFNIIYTGNGHISTYLRIFSGLGFLVGVSTQSSQPNIDMQCLDVSKRNQPFFHHTPIDHSAQKSLIDSFGKNALNMIPDGSRIVSKIGEGNTGHAYLVSDQYFNQQILKFVKTQRTIAGDHKGIEHEFAMQRKFADAGLAPKPISLSFYRPRANRSEEVAVIVMDRVYGTVGNLIDTVILSTEMINQIAEQIEVVLKKMCKEGLIHGDFHLWNLGFNFADNGGIKIIPIDMAYSCCVTAKVQCRPDFELKKLLQVLFSFSVQNKEQIPKINCTALLNPIQNMMLYVFKINPQEIADNAKKAMAIAQAQHKKYQNGALKHDIGPSRAL
jgi:hypothetical protein